LKSKNVARRRLGYAENDVVAIFSGKLIDRKQPLLFLEGISNLKNVKGLVLGDGPLMGACKEKAAVKGHVRFEGFVNQSHLGRYFMAADFLVLPSLEETWGLVINEAMLFGLPVIVSDQVWCRLDLVRSGQTGYVFPIRDGQALVRAMDSLAQDKVKRIKMGHQAMKLIRPFDIRSSADGLVEALNWSIKGE
jgi:glycosyltransferase involved in cell wall biosynthesis